MILRRCVNRQKVYKFGCVNRQSVILYQATEENYMIMRRKITETLNKWRESDSAECALLIDGARRVGKSFIVEEFAKAAYPSYLMINFKYVGNDVK